jgi:hypothetical protein
MYSSVEQKWLGSTPRNAAGNAEVEHDTAKIGADVALGQAGRGAPVGDAADGMALGGGREVAAAVTVECEVCALVEQ